MTRYFVIALLVLVGLGAIGYVVREKLAASPTALVAARGPADAGAKAAMVDAAPIGHVLKTVVVALTGQVERRVGDHWIAVKAGDSLDAQDAIRTAEGASARIDIAGKKVELGERTAITVGQLSAQVASIVLDQGRVSANGSADGRVIRIAAANSDAVAEAADGTFDVLASGRGDVTVAAETGNVKLSAHGTSVNIHGGEESTVTAGAAPVAPTKIPSSLFLKVNATGGGRVAVASVHGTTEPGAVVSVNGVRSAAVGGAFDAQVPLVEGSNVLVVSVEDATGRTQRQIIKRVVDTRGPKLDTAVDWK